MIGGPYMNDMIIPYLNQTLNTEDKMKFLEHIRECKECREELAMMMKVKKALESQKKELPKAVKQQAFDKINAQKDMKTVITDLFTNEIPTPKTSIKVVSYLLTTIKNTINLSLENI